MKETVISLLAEMIKEIKDQEGEPLSEKELFELLDENKDVRKIIEELVEDFYEDADELAVADVLYKGNSGSGVLLRMLSSEEKDYFSPEAYGFLIKMFNLGIIDVDTQEEIIDKCLEIQEKNLSLNSMKGIVFYVLSSRNPEFVYKGLIHYFDKGEIH
ncbi:MAG: DUF494 family protein [Nitrospinae bacterium]|nr:DUF494 family protein [Nitrospinota bacterium]